jgi:gas vesicle protein
MKVSIVLIISVLVGGIISFNPVLSLAPHEDSEDKKSSDSNTDKSSDTTTPPTEDNKQSEVIPIEPPTPTPTPTTPTTTATCSDGSDHKNDKICTAEQTNQEETVVQQQNTVTPHTTQPVHTGYLDNSLNAVSTQDKDINDTTLLIQLNNSAQ